jgi:hypothetical protein
MEAFTLFGAMNMDDGNGPAYTWFVWILFPKLFSSPMQLNVRIHLDPIRTSADLFSDCLSTLIDTICNHRAGNPINAFLIDV